MSKRVALCADEEILKEPSIIGLGGERLDAQEWLECFSEAEAFRMYVKNSDTLEEAWVAETHELEPINLAATIKIDRPDLRVCLSYNNESGSFRSRAGIAGIDSLLDQSAFIRQYTSAKAKYTASAAAQTSGNRDEAVGLDGISNPLSAEDEAQDQALPADEDATSDSSQENIALSNRHQGSSALPVREPSAGYFIPVVSGSGGAGKSTIAALCALFAQRCGYNTVLVDLDLQFGDMKHVLAVEDPVAVDVLLDQPSLIEKVMPRNGKPALICAPARLETFESLASRMPEVLDLLSDRFDVIIANTGSVWGEQVVELLERASKVLFLVGQNASSLLSCKHAVELCSRCGIATGPFVFAVNRVDKNTSLTSIDVSCALDGAQAIELREGGRDVEDFISAGCINQLVESDNELVASLKAVLVHLLPDFEGKESALGLSRRRRTLRRRKKSRLRKEKEIA